MNWNNFITNINSFFLESNELIILIADQALFLSLAFISFLILKIFLRKRVKVYYIHIILPVFILLCLIFELHIAFQFYLNGVWQQSYLKILFALASIISAIILWKCMPHALLIPRRSHFLMFRKKARFLEKKNTEEEHFFSSAIHEIRNHLNVINLSSQLLIENEGDEKDRNTLKKMIIQNGTTLNQLINNTLDLSKLNNGTLQPNFETYSLESLIEDLNFEYNREAKNKGINFTIKKEKSVPNNITTDPIRLTQILKNLISNAFKYTDSGFIELKINCKNKDKKSFVTFTIKDSGGGIPISDQPHIFKKYTRSKLHGKIEGVGIGLSLSKKLAKMLNGKIRLVQSSPSGSIFELKIITSIKHDAEPKDKLDIPKEINWKEKVILIADDAKENRNLFSIILKKTNAQIDYAENGAQAVEKCSRSNYDLILMDIEMPVLDGREACLKIKSIVPNVKIIAITGLSKGSETQTLIKQGFFDVIEKPINLKTFYQRIQDSLIT